MDKDLDDVMKSMFGDCKSMLNEMETELKKYDFNEAYQYLKPLKYMMFEALSDLYKMSMDRKNSGEELLNKIL